MRFLSSQLLVGKVLKAVAHTLPQKTAFVYENQKLRYCEKHTIGRVVAAKWDQQGR